MTTARPDGLLSLALCFGLSPLLSALPAAAAAAACPAAFAALDQNGDGLLSEDEAPAPYAQARLNGLPLEEGSYTEARFLRACENEAFLRPDPEAGAPFAGRMPFTEDQARDRALAAGLREVSELDTDAQGIRRGTAVLDGQRVSLALDYRGNLVIGQP